MQHLIYKYSLNKNKYSLQNLNFKYIITVVSKGNTTNIYYKH